MSKTEMAKVVPELKINVEITQNNIIDIAVAKEERRLVELSHQLKSDLKDTEKAVSEKRGAIGTLINKTVEGLHKKELASLKKALKVMGFPVKEDGEEIVTCFVDGVDDVIRNKKIGYKFSFNTSGYNRMETCYYKINLNSDLKALAKQLQDEQKLHAKISKEIMKTHSEIANISRMERQARAKIAEGLLSRTDDGQALLDSIDGVKSLPMPV